MEQLNNWWSEKQKDMAKEFKPLKRSRRDGSQVTVPVVLLSHLEEHQLVVFKSELHKNKYRPNQMLTDIKKAASVALFNLHKYIDAMGKPVPEKLKQEHQQLLDESAILRDFTKDIAQKLENTKVSKMTEAQVAQMLEKDDEKEPFKDSQSSSSTESSSSSLSSNGSSSSGSSIQSKYRK